MKIKFILIFTLIFMCKSYAQITTTITNILVNNQSTISNCSLIDFGSNSINSITINFKLTKPSNQAIGNCDLDILLKYATGSIGNSKASIIIQSGSWTNNNTEFNGQITANVSAGEIQVTGSSVYIECKTDTSAKTQSCEYPLTKTPTPEFNLQPTTLNISCGSTSSYVFTVVNVNNSSGTLSYSWNVGTGWKYNGVPVSGTFTTTTNVIQLSPASGVLLPSNVIMTPTLNGTTYTAKTTTINRPNIAQTITAISGVTTLCSGSTNYNFGTENVLTGQTVTWSLSNSTVATLSNASNTGVTLNLIGSGAVTLTATIADACGQSYNKTKGLFAGAPPAFAVGRGTAESEYCDTKYHYVPYTIANKNSLLNYSVTVAGMPPSTFKNFTNDGFVLRFLKNFSGEVDFTVTASNSCGSVSVNRSEAMNNCSSIPYSSQLKLSEPVSIFKVYPNPSNDVVYLDLVDANNVPDTNAQIKASLYDMLGFEKAQVKIKDNKTVIDVSTLPAGLYVLILNINGDTETHLISVN